MPTLYASEGQRRPAKPSVTQLVLYNMASILASVATGFDVRLSNVSPIHPKLQPQIHLKSTEQQANEDENDHEHAGRVHSEFGTPQRSTYAHTYHGPTKHVR